MGTDTDGFADGVSEFARPRIDDGAVDFVGVAGVVAEGGGDFGDVFGEGDGVGFAVVPGFDCGESGGVRVDWKGGKWLAGCIMLLRGMR